MRLRLGDRVHDLADRPPLVMGILNATPDSVADEAAFGDPAAIAQRGLAMAEQGAEIVDVGGESGRTDAPPVAAAQEIDRVLPVIERLVQAGVVVSCDTRKPEVARAAIAAGAALINDVSGLAEPELATVCAAGGAGLVITHTRAPAKQVRFPGYANVTADVVDFLTERVELARSHGVAEDAIVVDPGPDFAKTPAESVAVLRELAALRKLGRPLLLAVSRKYFVGVLTGRLPLERAAGTLAALAWGLERGCEIVRVHDVAATVDFLAVTETLRGRREVPRERADDSLRWLPRAP